MVRPALLAVDWGISSFRAYALDATGAVLDAVRSDAGILGVPDGAFEAVFRREAARLLAGIKDLPIIASGMITSRQGWIETPYVATPADAAAIARELVSHRASDNLALHFVPGLSRVGADGVPDVMRGEETQIIGQVAAARTAGSGLLVLPGTHSKWAVTEAGRITWFATFMTGELFAVLRTHSILGRLMAEAENFEEVAFRQGVDYARAEADKAGGLLKRLFSARTLGLFDKLPPAELSDYLSGLLIGSEISEALAMVGPEMAAGGITVIGGEALAMRYRRALRNFEIETVAAANDVAARGLYRIARAAGLLETSP